MSGIVGLSTILSCLLLLNLCNRAEPHHLPCTGFVAIRK